MIKKAFVESIGSEVTFARRKGTRHLRLSVKSDGVIRVTIPYGVPQIIADKFLRDKIDWIKEHHKPASLLRHGDHIGKSHRLEFTIETIDTIKTRLSSNLISVRLPTAEPWDSINSQEKARKASERALQKESKQLLPQRLDFLSKKHGIAYKSITTKKLKSRWGSCDNHKNIVLNIYLIQLEWQLIDYVILHELSHTHHQHHQSAFWDYLEALLPDYRLKRKLLKTQPTGILITKF